VKAGLNVNRNVIMLLHVFKTSIKMLSSTSYDYIRNYVCMLLNDKILIQVNVWLLFNV
jgi:hypothetical protein